MKQKFIHVAGTKLAYLDKNEEKENIIFFIHGNSLSSRSWNAQLNSELLKDYRLIAIDLPAHGDSEVAANPATDYSIPGLGAIMALAIKSLAGSSPYLMTGLSLGTNILAESLAFELRPGGIVLAGSCLVGEKYSLDSFAYPDTHIHVVFTEQAPENEVRKYAAQVMTNDKEAIVDEFIADYYGVKLPFRSVLMNSIQEHQFNDEIELVGSVNKPVLMIFGKDEQIINPDYLDDIPLNLWNQKIYKIPGASHLVNSDQPEAFNKLLAAYAADIFKA
jgi:pimeloyl-ACP methyl ester carboxylesterase